VDRFDDSTTITDFNPNDLILVHDQDMYFDSSAELLPALTLTPSSQTPLLSMVVKNMPNSLSESVPYCQMYMG
jgi:hypothetical protein